MIPDLATIYARAILATQLWMSVRHIPAPRLCRGDNDGAA